MPKVTCFACRRSAEAGRKLFGWHVQTYDRWPSHLVCPACWPVDHEVELNGYSYTKVGFLDGVPA